MYFSCVTNNIKIDLVNLDCFQKDKDLAVKGDNLHPTRTYKSFLDV